MEVLFTNSYISNRELLKDVYSYIYFKRKFVIACQGIMLLGWILGLMKCFNWFLLIFVPAYLLFRYFVYRNQVATVMKRNYEMHGNEVSVVTNVTEECIQNNASTGATTKIEYSNIRKAVQTKNLILLRTKANVFLIFPKEGFTKGSKEEFIAFLRRKGIKA